VDFRLIGDISTLKIPAFAIVTYCRMISGFCGFLLNPEVTLDYSTFRGVAKTFNGVGSFLRMSFATDN